MAPSGSFPVWSNRACSVVPAPSARMTNGFIPSSHQVRSVCWMVRFSVRTSHSASCAPVQSAGTVLTGTSVVSEIVGNVSAKRMGVSSVRAATVRNVRTVEPAVRAVRDEKPRPIPQTEASRTATSRITRRSAVPGVSPMARAMPKNGTLATRKAHAAAQAASSLPATISTGVRSVTWRVASVPAFRSPLIPVEASVGVTSRPSPSTRNVTAPKSSGPWGVRPVPVNVLRAPDVSRVMAPTTTNHTTSATIHRVERTR